MRPIGLKFAFGDSSEVWATQSWAGSQGPTREDHLEWVCTWSKYLRFYRLLGRFLCWSSGHGCEVVTLHMDLLSIVVCHYFILILNSIIGARVLL